MNETTTQVAHDVVFASNAIAKPMTVPLQCSVCGDRAFRMYIGVMVCPSCKTFFKRNAEAKQAQRQCHFDGHCNVNVLNRHICRFCRLEKCFTCGMQSERLRGPFPKSTKTKPRQTTTGNRQVQQFPTLNLLRADRSTLSVDQWTLLSNLIHCYDEHSGSTVVDRVVHEQKALPVKLRFNVITIHDLFASLMTGAQLLFEKNADFLSLNPHDRSLMLHGKLKYISGLSSCVILHSAGLFDNPIFCHTVESAYGSTTLAGSKHAGSYFETDIIFMKLVLAIILFSTFDYTVYTSDAPVNLSNGPAMHRIQDAYAELAWRYLIYKFNYTYAISRFSDLIRCIFLVNNALMDAVTHEHYNDLLDDVSKRTKEILLLNDWIMLFCDESAVCRSSMEQKYK